MAEEKFHTLVKTFENLAVRRKGFARCTEIDQNGFLTLTRQFLAKAIEGVCVEEYLVRAGMVAETLRVAIATKERAAGGQIESVILR